MALESKTCVRSKGSLAVWVISSGQQFGSMESLVMHLFRSGRLVNGGEYQEHLRCIR